MRSEEEKTNDILIHEKRSNAQDIIDAYKKTRRKAMLIACISAVVLFCIMISFIMGAYDSENIPLLTALVALYIIIALAAYFLSGSILCRSAKKYFVSLVLIYKWEEAIDDLHAIEEKQAEKVVRPEEIEIFEKKLITLCDKITESK